jgi:hypothetical protein
MVTPESLPCPLTDSRYNSDNRRPGRITAIRQPRQGARDVVEATAAGRPGQPEREAPARRAPGNRRGTGVSTGPQFISPNILNNLLIFKSIMYRMQSVREPLEGLAATACLSTRHPAGLVVRQKSASSAISDLAASWTRTVNRAACGSAGRFPESTPVSGSGAAAGGPGARPRLRIRLACG